MNDYDENVVEELSAQRCWELLRHEDFGRLAYRLADEVNVAPVNYAVDGETLLFTTAEGSKLLGVTIYPDVVFEIDRFDDEIAESVVLRGRARKLEEDEEHRVEKVSLRPWAATLKYNVVEIAPTGVTGRRFHLAAG